MDGILAILLGRWSKPMEIQAQGEVKEIRLAIHRGDVNLFLKDSPNKILTQYQSVGACLFPYECKGNMMAA